MIVRPEPLDPLPDVGLMPEVMRSHRMLKILRMVDATPFEKDGKVSPCHTLCVVFQLLSAFYLTPFSFSGNTNSRGFDDPS